MKILIIPDVHGRSFWKDAVEKYMDECDKVVFLGDYVDPYRDEGVTKKQAMTILDEIIKLKQENPDKVVLLIGNHDAHYCLNGFVKSSRFDSSHQRKIREKFMSHMSFFKLAHEEIVAGKRILFTHAGLMNSWVERNQEIITDTSADGLNKLLGSPAGTRALCDISNYRTWLGDPTGSILWSDIMEKGDVDDEGKVFSNEDSAAKGYDFQIFGHTLVKKEIITDAWACLDCMKAFILNDDGVIIEC
jgi:predicted phosphodiesterase